MAVRDRVKEGDGGGSGKGVGGSEVKRGMGNIEKLDENWQIR